MEFFQSRDSKYTLALETSLSDQWIVAFRSSVLGEILGSSRVINNICNVHGGGVEQHTCHLFTIADCLTPLICR